jgi:hypothetical protein
MSKRCTVAEMVEVLLKLPPDAALFVSGYEGGYYDAIPPSVPARLKADVNAVWFFGPHEVDNGGELCGYLIGPDTCENTEWPDADKAG